MSLSIVIPSHNPETLFFTTLNEVLQNHPQWQVILIDDASDCELRDLLPAHPNLTVLRNDQSRGAGACRNLGITRITGEYTLFLDDDDFMDWSVIENIIAEMDSRPETDFAMASYRFLRNGRVHPAYPQDQRIMNRILNGASSRVAVLDGNEDLLRVTNFPWTKVYRSAFINRIGLRFSETSVQNDIYAHWQSFLQAGRFLLTNQIQCTKTDNDRGTRVSNTADTRRLQAFIALRETYTLVRNSQTPRVETAFWAFYRDLVRWMLDKSLPAARPALMREHAAFAAVMPPNIRLEQNTGIKTWEIWDMNHLSDIILQAEPDHLVEQPAPHALLTEITRLKHLAAELRRDNDRLRGDIRHRDGEVRNRDGEIHRLRHDSERLRREVHDLAREVNSKATQTAISIRTFYRGIFPGRRSNQK